MSRVPAVENHKTGSRVRFKDGYRVQEGYSFLPLGLEARLLHRSRATATCSIAHAGVTIPPIQMNGAGTLT